MQKIIWKNYILTSVIFSFLCFFSNISEAAHTEVYMNTTLGVSIRGPENWFLEMKDHPSPSADFVFKDQPYLFALFSKYNFNDRASWPNPVGSMISVYISPPENKSAMMIINKIYNNLSEDRKKEVIEPPREIKLNNRDWAVMTSLIKKNEITLYQVTYVTVYTGGNVQIEAATTEKDYNPYRKIFDDVVSQIIFDNDKNNLTSKSMQIKN